MRWSKKAAPTCHTRAHSRVHTSEIRKIHTHTSEIRRIHVAHAYKHTYTHNHDLRVGETCHVLPCQPALSTHTNSKAWRAHRTRYNTLQHAAMHIRLHGHVECATTHSSLCHCALSTSHHKRRRTQIPIWAFDFRADFWFLVFICILAYVILGFIRPFIGVPRCARQLQYVFQCVLQFVLHWVGYGIVVSFAELGECREVRDCAAVALLHHIQQQIRISGNSWLGIPMPQLNHCNTYCNAHCKANGFRWIGNYADADCHSVWASGFTFTVTLLHTHTHAHTHAHARTRTHTSHEHIRAYMYMCVVCAHAHTHTDTFVYRETETEAPIVFWNM